MASWIFLLFSLPLCTKLGENLFMNVPTSFFILSHILLSEVLLLFFVFQLRKIHFYSIFTYVSHPYHCFFSCLCNWALTSLPSLSCKIEEFLINLKKIPQIQHHCLVWNNCLYTQWTTLFVLDTDVYHICSFLGPKILATLLSLL